MAKKPPESDIQIEKARLSTERFRIVQENRTKRFFIGCLFGTIGIGIIAWAAVRITDKPPWLVFGLALLSALTAPTGYLLIYGRRFLNLPEMIEAYAKLRAREELEHDDDQGRPKPGESNGP